MNLIRSLAACVAIGLSLIAARAQFQVVHDVPNTISTPQVTPLLLADGNMVTHHWDAGQHIFRKYDASGMLIWSRVLAGSSMNTWSGEETVILMSDGISGFRFIRSAEITSTPIGELSSEYLNTYSYHIGNVDGGGEVTNTVLLKKSFTNFTSVGGMLEGIDAARTPDNGMIVLTTASEVASGSMDVVKIGPNGAVNWGRSVGRDIGMPGAADPTTVYNILPKGKVAVSSIGRIYVTEASGYGFAHMRLAELDDSGDLIWMKQYVYGNTSPGIMYHDLQVDASGSVHAAGALSTSVGQFHIFLRTTVDGTLDRADIYRTPFSVQAGHLGIDDQGRRYHRFNASLPLVGTAPYGLLIADTLGAPARFIHRDDQVILPNNVFIVPQKMDVAGDRLAIGGLLHHEHVDLAYTTRYESTSSFDTDALLPCLMSDTVLAHIPVPLNIMTTMDATDAASIDVSAYYTSEPLSLTFTDEVLDALAPLCTFAANLLGVNVGLSEDTPAEHTPLVMNSLVAQGSPILLNETSADVVEVYDIHGALVKRSRLGGNRSLPTTGWTSGVYVIRTMNDSNAPMRVGRVVLD